MASRDRVSQAKSRAEKSRPPTVPVPQVEIVPGRLSEGEWLSLISIEEAEDNVGDILAGLLDQVLEECYRVYLARQCIPYVINQAREAMLQIIEWRFLVRDEGETGVPTDPTWQEDEEPVACITDSWAQGSVPVLQAVPSPEEAEFFCSDEAFGKAIPLASIPEEAPLAREGPEVPAAGLALPGSLVWKREVPQLSLHEVRPLKSKSSKVLFKFDTKRSSMAKGPGPATKTQLAHLTYYGPPALSEDTGRPLDAPEEEEEEPPSPMAASEVSQLPVEEESLRALQSHPTLLPPSCSNLLRIQAGRPPHIKDVFYDESGNITVVPRLDTARLPKRWIKPSVEVVDPDMESRRQEALKTVSGRCKQRRHAKLPRGRTDTMDQCGIQPPGIPQVGLWDGTTKLPWKDAPEPAACLPPPSGRLLEPTSFTFVKPTLLMETIELAPGVTVQGAGTANRHLQPAAQEKDGGREHGVLWPVRPRLPTPLTTLEQLAQEPKGLPLLHAGGLLGWVANANR